MAKLTKQQWQDAREVWEKDKREGHQWLSDELAKMGLEVDRATIAKAAKRQGWVKGGVPKNGTHSDKKNVTRKAKASLKKVTQVKPKNPMQKPGIDEPEWEEVEDEIHLNSKYCKEFNDQAYKLCLLGATDAEMADFFEVDERTINRWKNQYPDFRQSIKNGKTYADACMAESLYKRGCGYQYQEIRTKEALISQSDNDVDDSKDVMSVVEIITTTKDVAPDTGAAFIWMKNRRSDKWRDKVEIVGDIQVNQLDVAVLEQRFISRMREAYDRQLKVLEERGLNNA